MEIKKFVENFANQFDESDDVVFSENLEFRNIDEWSSLIALSIIAMVDEEYNVVLSGEDLRSANTIGELFEIVKNKS